MKHTTLWKKIVACLLVIWSMLSCTALGGQAEARVVRVGWFNVEGVMTKEADGSYSGYCYDYLQEITRYANVTYEYVPGTWQECMDRLATGEIDLMPYVQRTAERVTKMSFISSPIGQTYAVLTTLKGNDAFVSGDPSTYDGANVGVIEGSVEFSQMRTFMTEEHFHATMVAYDTMQELIDALNAGEIDMMLSMNYRILDESEQVIDKFGVGRCYLAVRRDDAELYNLFSDAVESLRLYDENLTNRLAEKYFPENLSNVLILSAREQALLSEIGKVRVVVPPEEGYVRWQRGEQQGGIVYALAETILPPLGLTFDYVEVESVEELHAMMADPDVPTLFACFPYDYTDAARWQVVLTTPYMTRSYMSVSMGQESATSIVYPASIRNFTEIIDAYSDSTAGVTRKNTTACLEAVLDGIADTAFVESLNADALRTQNKYRNMTYTLLREHDSACFAVAGNQAKDLALLISRAVGCVSPDDLSDIILENRITASGNVTLLSLVADNPGVFLLVALMMLVIAAGISQLVIRRQQSRAQRNAEQYAVTLRMKQDLEETQASMEAAISNADMMYFEYFPETHTALEHTAVHKGKDAFELDERLENYPDSWFELNYTLEEYVPILRDAFRQIDEGAEKATCDVQNRVGSKVRWHRYNFTSIYDSNGHRTKVACTALDITLQKEAEERYRRQFNAVMQINPDTLCTFRMNLTLNECSRGEGTNMAVAILNTSVSVDRFIELMQQIVPPEDWPRFHNTFARTRLLQAWQSGRGEVAMTHQYLDSDQSTHWGRTVVRMFENPSAEEVEAVWFANNVDSEVQEELIVQHLTNAEYDFLAVIDVCNTTFTITNVKKQRPAPLMDESPDYAANVEYFVSHAVMADDRERVKAEMALDVIREKLADLPTYTVMYREYEGERLVYKQQRYSYLDVNRRKIIMLKLDITDTYLKEQEQVRVLERTLHQAEEANRAKTDFLSRMSHDMRTPMNGIIGLAELSRDEQDAEVLRNNIRRIEESGEYLLSLINDTLDMNKIESNKIVLNPEPVDGVLFINNIVDMIRMTADAKGVKFNLRVINAAQNATVVIDKVRLKQIFVNLLSNAVKFTPQGGHVDFIIERVRMEGNIAHDRFIVRDSGIGMSSQFIATQLFQPFAQEQNNASANFAGSGLGLAIVKRLVEKMGGSISVTSRLGFGTEFTILMDIEHSDAKVVQLPVREKHGVESLKGRKILLVEDHPLNTEIACKLLEKVGCQVTTAANGALAVSTFASSPVDYFDVILMDVRMPVMNGLEATRAIRAMKRDDALTVPIVAMTANAFEEDVQQTRDAGMDAHLAKPISPQRLYETLIDFVEED